MDKKDKKEAQGGKDKVPPKEEKKAEEKPKVPATVLQEIKSALINLRKGLTNNDNRNVLKITKQIRRFKKAMKSHHLKKIWETFFPEDKSIKFEDFKDFDPAFTEDFKITQEKLQGYAKFPELEIYLKLHYLVYLVHNKHLELAYNLSTELVQKAKDFNKRHFDNLNSLIYFYYSRTRELLDRGYLEIRDELFEAYRTASLRHDEIGQATLLNLLFRNYLHYNHYEAAQHLDSKCNFPESKSNNEYCRYLYYIGKIKAIQLDYAQSLSSLNQAIRKVPDQIGQGFRIEAQKLACVVEMLLGDIPNRDIFMQPEYQKPLFPYYKLVQSVLKGNLLDFSNIVAKYAKIYIKDKMYTLIMRLPKMVIKTGLRKINLSYSRISLADVATKLNLPRNTDVEFIVAKAIRDGTLNAEIDHENKFIIMKEKKDLYSSNEPQQAYTKRITYCLNLYNQAIKALQYPQEVIRYTEKETDEISPEELLKLLVDSDADF